MSEDQRFQDRVAECIQLISNFVVPLYRREAAGMHFVGSGFFVNFESATVLVSAAHVLGLFSAEEPLFVFRDQNDPVQIGGRRHLSAEDGLDLGFIVTEGVSLPWPGVDRFSCDQSYLLGERVPRAERRYVVTGYPASKNRYRPAKRAFVGEVHGYHAHSIPDDQYAEHGLDPLTHIALPLDVRRVYGTEGHMKHFPSPKGMSGSPIWEIYDENEGQEGPRTFPLVGVATNYRKDPGLLFGTDVAPLLERLCEAT